MRDRHSAVLSHPFYSSVTSFPGVCFVLTLLNDIAYWRTGNLQWQNFAEWLLLAGLIVGGLVLLAQGIELLRRGRPASGPGWMYVGGTIIILVLALINSFVHARDGWTAVVPEGLALSFITVMAMLVKGWLGASAARRHSGVTING
jgi:uncharacterized membrane protein